MDRLPNVRRKTHRATTNRRRHLNHRYAKARTSLEVAAVEFDRARRAIKRLARRDAEAAQRAARVLAEQVGRLASQIETEAATTGSH